MLVSRSLLTCFDFLKFRDWVSRFRFPRGPEKTPKSPCEATRHQSFHCPELEIGPPRIGSCCSPLTKALFVSLLVFDIWSFCWITRCWLGMNHCLLDGYPKDPWKFRCRDPNNSFVWVLLILIWYYRFIKCFWTQFHFLNLSQRFVTLLRWLTYDCVKGAWWGDLFTCPGFTRKTLPQGLPWILRRQAYQWWGLGLALETKELMDNWRAEWAQANIDKLGNDHNFKHFSHGLNYLHNSHNTDGNQSWSTLWFELMFGREWGDGIVFGDYCR